MGERSVVALALLLGGAALLASTIGRQFADLGGAFSPTFFPRIVLWLWIGLAGLDLVAELRRRAAPAPMPMARVAVIGVAFVAYALALVPIGFFLASLAFSAVALWSLGIRRPLQLLAFSVGVPAALVGLFNHVLTLPLPTSPFTHLF
jgi:hypothetical protein